MGFPTQPVRLALLVVAAALLGAAATGCASQCKEIRAAYEREIQREAVFAPPADTKQMPVHVGIAVRTSLLNDIVDRAVVSQLEKALDFADKIAIASAQTVSIRTEGNVADVELFADPGCENCLRLEGKLGGSVAVKVPHLGIQKVPLTGTFQVVAPLKFARDGGDGVAVQLDLSKAAELNRSRIDAHITKLPPTWSRVLQAPLSERLLSEVSKSMGAVTLFRYAGPDLGIDGLEILPARLVSNAKKGVVFVGFTTNLARLSNEDMGLKPVIELAEGDDASMSVHPDLIAPALRAMMRDDALSRRYTKDGKSDPEAPYHITVSRLDVGPDDARGPIPFELNFSIWRMADSGQCYRADALARGALGVAEDVLSVRADDVEIVDSTLPDITLMIAKWVNGDFLTASKTVMKKSLSAESIRFPGGEAKLRSGQLELSSGAVILRGKIDLP